MRVELAPVSQAEAGELRALLDPYLIEHADQVDPDRAHGDPTDQPYFDLYWVEPERAPFWILADGRRAGFVLLNTYSPSGRGTERSISEFCVLPEFRRGGVRATAAELALATHKACGSCRSIARTGWVSASGPGPWRRPESGTGSWSRRPKA